MISLLIFCRQGLRLDACIIYVLLTVEAVLHLFFQQLTFLLARSRLSLMKNLVYFGNVVRVISVDFIPFLFSGLDLVTICFRSYDFKSRKANIYSVVDGKCFFDVLFFSKSFKSSLSNGCFVFTSSFLVKFVLISLLPC